jgi:hypothetical protein
MRARNINVSILCGDLDDSNHVFRRFWVDDDTVIHP